MKKKIRPPRIIYVFYITPSSYVNVLNTFELRVSEVTARYKKLPTRKPVIFIIFKSGRIACGGSTSYSEIFVVITHGLRNHDVER